MIPEITRILFATALSDRSASTLRHVVGLAAATGAEIHILHVLPQLSDDAKIALEAFVTDDSLRELTVSRRLEATRQSLSERQDRFWSSLDADTRKVRAQVVSIEVIEGFPAEVILHESERRACDLIVLGTHEQGLSHSFLGEIAKRVLRRSRIPTLIVPYRD
jgi:nucleotide-binding universal stress UspA family protein